jgi:general secretion pathway protein C
MLHFPSSSKPSRWVVKGLTLLVWALAAAGAVIWTLKFPVPSSGVPAALALTPAGPSGDRLSSDVARSLGHRAVNPSSPVAADLQFQLLGVIAGGSGAGSALISVGGQPPKAFKVGQTLTDGVVLQRLKARQAELGSTANGPVLWTLELPAAATGG